MMYHSGILYTHNLFIPFQNFSTINSHLYSVASLQRSYNEMVVFIKMNLRIDSLRSNNDESKHFMYLNMPNNKCYGNFGSLFTF